MTFTRPKRRVDRVFLHCSASDDTALLGEHLTDEIRRWHKARGFSDVGYHFLIDKMGEIMKGRSLEKTPAAQKSHNTGTIAICIHGLELEKFTATALDSCLLLCAEINLEYEGRISFHGHKEVSSKECPIFSYRELLGLDRFGRMP